jgi:hypothetical protein
LKITCGESWLAGWLARGNENENGNGNGNGRGDHDTQNVILTGLIVVDNSTPPSSTVTKPKVDPAIGVLDTPMAAVACPTW